MTAQGPGLQSVKSRLLDDLRLSPVCDVCGVVDSRGLGAVKVGDEQLWTVQVRLAAWRMGSLPLHRSELLALTLADDQRQQELCAALHEYDVVHLRARVSEQNCLGRPCALLERVVGTVADTELAQIAADLQVPIEFRDEQLGAFVWDRRLNWFKGSTTWCSVPLQLMLNPRNDSDPRKAAAHAGKLLDEQLSWDTRIRNCAAARLVAICNESWRNAQDPRITAEEFVSSMTPESLEVDALGGFSLWFDDGGLFGGHAILVRGDTLRGPTHAEIAG